MAKMYRTLTGVDSAIHVIDPRHKKFSPCSSELEAMCGAHGGRRGVHVARFVARFEGPVSDATCIECRECCVKDGIA